MGTLQKLSDKQEALKSLILDVRKKPDPTYDEAVFRSELEGLPIDEVVNVAIINAEILGHSADAADLGYAAEFLDHLDTLGWKITPKNRRQRREMPEVQGPEGGPQ